ncbi:MAG: carboxypeptidase regulatory-like domain-containing protein [Actinocatenispora sp.]
MALVGLGLSPAQAAPSAHKNAKTAKPNVEQVCGAPAKGEFTCFALRRTDVGGGKGVQPNADPTGYGPADLRSAYNLPDNGGSGQTIAIVDAYDNPNAEADLAVYREHYGLAPCTTDNGCFQKVDQRGGTDYPTPDAGWAGEIALDVDMVSAAAPNAHILLVEGDSASFDDLGASVNTAVELGAKYVSNSYGTGYSSTPGSGESSDELAYEEQYYNHPGVAVTVSSGDDDYGVAFPAASQYVTSVGGTALTHDSSSRGWHEAVWHNSYGGPGSGCSVYEPKPAFQQDTGCDNRAVSDVSAVADPETGVSVYNSYQASGWAQYGGTSASSPLIAGVYATAGTPVEGSYPNTYPYANPGSLYDVTDGLNGSCDPDYLCTAGAGYDGPTGLGTPNGVASFRSGPHGEVSGTVTDSASGDGISGATVKVGDSSATTGADGGYDLTVSPGSYDVTASAYGYSDKTAQSVTVADGGTVTQDFALSTVPKATVSGTVADDSGHAWPLYAKVTVDGVPGAGVFTDPTTGRYSIDLPQGKSYTLHVDANYPGYKPTDQDVTVGDGDVNQNIGVKVDAQACAAPGYTVDYQGTRQTFDGSSAPEGWTTHDATDGGGWGFTDAGNRGNLTGGDGGFAMVDSDHLGSGKTQDTTLTSPVVDMSDHATPKLQFDTYDRGYSGQTSDVDVTVDGGQTWTNVWHQTASGTVSGHEDIALPMAANQSAVQVRFHFTAKFGYYWEVDNAFIGNADCKPVHGGLIAGQVTDANTHDGVSSAKVSSNDKPAETANAAPTADDPNLGDGFFWLFSSATGAHKFTAAKAGYATQAKNVNVATNFVTKANFTLKAGKVTVDAGSVDKTVKWGGHASVPVTLTNTGGQPATVKIGEQAGGFQMQGRSTGAPKHNVKATVTNRAMHGRNGKVLVSKHAAPAGTSPSDDAWSAVPNFPTPVQDNAVSVENGKVYSAFGYDGSEDLADLYVYDPDAGSWSQLASASETREGNPAHGFINGKFYVTGGWGASGDPVAKTEVYDPAADSWSTVAAAPKAYAGAGSAVLGGKLYSVGGCTDSCGNTDVLVYDASADSWSEAADYPESTSWTSCGGIDGKLYCAGGSGASAASKHGFVYDPAADSWSPIADLPVDVWGSSYTAANGKLLISGGAAQGSSVLTNQGWAYDPASDAWSALPNANNSLYRSGGAIGFYKVGGNPGGSLTPPVAASELLGGYDQGGGSDVSWLSVDQTEVTLAAGASRTVNVSLDASVEEVTQPGTFTASLSLQTDTPYQTAPVDVAMHVTPPKTWGKVAGTIKGNDGKGNVAPLAGATVEIDSWAANYTLKTDKDGNFALWMDTRNNPLTVIVAKDGYQPQVKTVKITKGETVTLNVTLKHS